MKLIFLRLRLEQQVNTLQIEIKYKDLIIKNLEANNHELKIEKNNLIEKILKSFEELTKKSIKIESEKPHTSIQTEKDICKKYLRENKLDKLFSYLNLEVSSPMSPLRKLHNSKNVSFGDIFISFN